MSFYDADAHEQQGHADSCIYSFSQGGPWCLACLLNSLADVSVLNGRKAYLLRCVRAAFLCDLYFSKIECNRSYVTSAVQDHDLC